MPRSISCLLLHTTTWVGICALAACSPSSFKRSADREVFGILGRKLRFVKDADDVLLDITPPKPVRLDVLMANLQTAEFLGDRAHIEKGARVLTLADALNYAVHRNRTYLGRKEAVYLSALTLTLTRQQYGPILTGTGATGYSDSSVEAGVNNFVRTATLTTDNTLGLDVLTRIGTRLAVDLTTDFTRFFSGGRRNLTDSAIGATLSQPLLRGFGVLAAAEPLRQDERDVLYAIRDFTQYRKDFAVDIASGYYGTLQSREAVRNRYLAYKNSRLSLERERALAAANMRSQSGVLQIEQSRLNYERNWITSIRTYEDALDDFKVTLGLPVTEKVVLDPKELEKISVGDPPGQMDGLVETAVATRLDLFNQRERLQDAGRLVKIAEQNLLPTVNLVTNYEIGTPTGNAGFELNPSQRVAGAGLAYDLNLNTKPERNSLRASQIAVQQAQRALDLAEEQVRNDVRSDWRALTVARTQYELARQGLALAERRLEIEEALLEEGLGVARDLVDAQDRLITARDSVLSTQVGLTLARLELWKDMGILYIKKDGSWVNVLENERPKGDS